MDFSINNGEPAGEPFVKKKKKDQRTLNLMQGNLIMWQDLESNAGCFDYGA